jgi:thiamine biosynthesis protein ThiI
MMRTASALAEREGAEALVTGDSLGQVSSQTLRNLSVVEDAATLPVLRPLVAWDKSEIVREAQDIGTYEIANLPAEDCCTLFASPLAETRAAPDQLVSIERRLDLERTVAELLAAADVVRPKRESPSMQPTLQSHYAGNIER